MSILLNYPRLLPSIDVLRRKYFSLEKKENKELFIKWLEVKLPLYKLHNGDIAHIVTAEFLSGIRNKLNKKRPRVEYHDKSKAYRIERNAAHGGTPWRSECFKTKEEAEAFIEEKDLISDY